MKSEREAGRAIELYADMVRRICFLHLKSFADTEDIFQTVFLKYVLYEGAFESAEHEKAWFIRVTINACKDLLKSLFRRSTVSMDALLQETAATNIDQQYVLDAVLALPTKYKDAIYLYYFEGYSAKEIANILKRNESTIFSLLSRGRSMLKDTLGGEELE
ncbi:MAG: RNA polymerase sigma factor [Clostridia bacterium]|nr:RNA polymerase sigma factor [Clostridia bacterium]